MNVRILIEQIENNMREKHPNKPYTFDRKNGEDWLRLQDLIDQELNKLQKIREII